MRLQDLTHVFTEGFPVFTFDPPAREDLVTIPTGGFYSQKWTFGEHSGTHMDAPGHFATGGRLSPDITPQELLEAALWLVERRDVTGIGVDTLSLDPGNSSTFPVHVNFLKTDRYGLENLANLDKIPPRGAVAYVGLIPWEQGSGGPCRVIANW